jgi:hypothetical protein
VSGLDMGDEGELFLLPLDNVLPNWKKHMYIIKCNVVKHMHKRMDKRILQFFLLTVGIDPSAEQLLVFLERPPNMLLFASAFVSVCVLTLAIRALRTVSMNLLPAPEMVPLPHSDDDDDEAADFVSSVFKPLVLLPLPSPLYPKKSLVLSFSSSHKECNNEVRVLSYINRTV